MKKVLSLFLSVLMLTSIVAAVDLSAFASSTVTYNGNTYYTSIEDAGADLKENLMNYNTKFTIYYYSAANESADDVEDAVIDEAVKHTGNPLEGDYLYWKVKKWSVVTSNYARSNYYTFKFEITYYTTATQEEELVAAAESLSKKLKLSSMSDYDKVYTIYKYVCNNVTYTDENDLTHSAYGAMINGKAVCQGISSLLYLLYNMNDIDCRMITNFDHGWNIVKLGKYYFYLDATNDLGKNKDTDTFKYFLQGANNFDARMLNSVDEKFKTDEFKSTYNISLTDYKDGGSSGTPKDTSSDVDSTYCIYTTTSVSGNTTTTTRHISYTHTLDKGKVTKKATCTSTGVKTYTCTKCAATKTEKIAKVAHTYKATKKATTKKGGTLKCTVCGKTKTVNKIKSMSLSTSSYTYNGKAKKPSVTVKDSKGNKISSKYYTVSYISRSTGKKVSSMKNPGKYYVKVTFKTRYSGSIKKAVTIKPKKTSIKSISASKKGFTVKWGKVSTQNTGYQIQYSTSKSFKNAKTATVKKTGTTSKKVTKLKAKKKYYVRVRTYKTVKINGKNTKIYSSWSSAKGVTTKK